MLIKRAENQTASAARALELLALELKLINVQ
jgi:hypothetical protein